MKSHMGDHDYRRWYRAMIEAYERLTGVPTVGIPPQPVDEWYRVGVTADDAAQRLYAAT